MEEQLSSLAVTHLLQHTLRSFCNSQWVYAVFWRILPRNYPPPKWDIGHVAYDRSRGNRRNWILVWEDGFCNFAASATASTAEMNSSDCPSSSVHGNSEFQHCQGLQPELFFKMSHEIYNYGEGLIGKVAADRSHKWIYNEPVEQDTNFLSAWHNSADSHPRTWEAQFRSGIKTIALIAVREGVVQLGATQKVIEDLSYVVLLRKKFSYIESIPGVLLPHPSSTPFPFKIDSYGSPESTLQWHHNHHYSNIAPPPPQLPLQAPGQAQEYYDHFINQVPFRITPSMSSLDALLSKLPSVVPPPPPPPPPLHEEGPPEFSREYESIQRPSSHSEFMETEKVAAKEEFDEDHNYNNIHNSQQQHHHNHHHHFSQLLLHHDLNVSGSSNNANNNEFYQ